MRAAYEAEVFPALLAFRPELILISAGFDAHADDPLAEPRTGRRRISPGSRSDLCDVADDVLRGPRGLDTRGRL